MTSRSPIDTLSKNPVGSMDTKKIGLTIEPSIYNNRILFDLLKQHKWDDFIKIINEHDDINVNIRDEGNNYLVQYAIWLNRKDIVGILINRGAKLDITDSDGRSILYIPIKFAYNDILQLLLFFNRSQIGISLVDIQDVSQYIPLHYAIIFNNIEAIKLLLTYGSNVNKQNNLGLGAIHLAVYSKKPEVMELILNAKANINLKHKKNGETALHMACNLELYHMAELLLKRNADPDVQDTEDEYTPLIYSTVLNRLDFVKLLLDKGANINIQDQYGNTALHYAILENRMSILQYILNSKPFDPNLVNTEGRTILHLVLQSEKVNDDLIKHILPLARLDIVDNVGSTALHLLTKNDLWKSFIDILKTKKLDIYLKNRKNIMPIDNVDKKDMNEFINLVTESYLYTLKTKDPLEWDRDWEQICSQKKMDEKDKQKLLKLTKNKNNNHLCETLIKDRILKDKVSYPYREKYKIKIIPSDIIKFGTFVGVPIDVLSGTIYLMKKYKNIISCPLTTDFTDLPELTNYYKTIGTTISDKGEYYNFEAVWIDQKLFFPTTFSFTFKKFLQSEKRFYIMPLGIELKGGSHAGYIIYDNKTKELERFETYGQLFPKKLDYHPKLLDPQIKQKFKEHVPAVKFIQTTEFLPKIGFQMLDIHEGNKYRYIGDPGGFCVLWSIWYTDMRISNADIPRNKLVLKTIAYMRRYGLSFRNMIRNYSASITDIRDKVLEDNGLDINRWLNDDYTDRQLEDVNHSIKQIIESVI
jgi:ankyrin repeat protein